MYYTNCYSKCSINFIGLYVGHRVFGAYLVPLPVVVFDPFELFFRVGGVILPFLLIIIRGYFLFFGFILGHLL